MTGVHQFRRIICSHCGDELDIPVYCGSRFCPVCNRARLARIRDRISFILNIARSYPDFQLKMITLTIRNQADVATGCQILTKAFRRLRSKRAWKSRISGGLYVIEVSGLPGHYHVHLHILVNCRFFPVRLLSKCWADVAPGKVVYISRIPIGAAVTYITKYLTKPSVPENAVTHVDDGLRSLRLFQPFGFWHGVSTKWVRKTFPCSNCGHCSWDTRDIFYSSLRSKKYDRPSKPP